MEKAALSSNGVKMTPRQHEAALWMTVRGREDSFIVRLEAFLAEMDRREHEQTTVTTCAVVRVAHGTEAAHA